MYREQHKATGHMSDESSATATDLHKEAFAFVQSLAHELSAGKVELPSFPDIALKVRKALDDETVTVARIARIVSAEAGLASRIIVMANSPAMGYGGKPVSDLQTAVTRIGLANVRAAALAFSLGQLRRAIQFKHIMHDLERLWRQSTKVAALCRVLSLRLRGVNADLAMLAGLLHNIGSVYVMARAGEHARIVRDREHLEMLLDDWSAGIGRSIAENWGLPDEVVEAIGQQADTDRVKRGSADLTDVLCVAVSIAGKQGDRPMAEAIVSSSSALARLGLDGDSWQAIVAESEADIAELQAALAG
jgi:HD-like signal output (HDOD) protein